MKKSNLFALAGASLMLSAGAAAAQMAISAIDARQAEVARRIDAGVAHNDLTREEANSLRDDFHQIERVEQEFRRGGFTGPEIAELNRRLAALETRVVKNRNDGDRRGGGGSSYDQGWQSLDLRRAELERRLDAGVAQKDLTRDEAGNLREEFNALQRVEHDYRQNGLTTAERQDLDRRYQLLTAKIRVERRDDQRR